ncbi:L-type lectin-like domain-containing protein [Lachancea thermotolerans]|uniref:KLTH0G19294p n=1 Tax=Lachancea thermotolerans (strain ATCC 56472 / CBS 6340 / NRRL Y-8284) TaxID=559295 RepID=C5DNR8_LACTC|nr:KLTH0G19294p [Lachancea thermotolerans CBS 6340]CAR25429.1 KLTH0G19294p [Lachancea thermotolerans CBS 6340]
MLVQHLWTLAAFAQLGLAHSKPKTEEQLLNNDFSLPDLIQTKKLPDAWVPGENAVLEEGRVVLTPKKSSKGSLWTKNAYTLGTSFTAEWTVRSTNHRGKSPGGLALWFVNANSPQDTELFNGPSKFEGLQLLIDNNGELESTLRGQLNDGTQQFTSANIYDKTFGSCLLAYQDSTVPLTVRLTYDSANEHFFKVQVDNRVCFQTKKIHFPAENYKFGITATNADNEESFELLQLEVFDGVLEEALKPNANAMEQPKLFTKLVNEKTGDEELRETSPLEMAAAGTAITNNDLLKKMNRLEGKILANDIGILASTIDELIQVQKQQAKNLEKVLAMLGSKSIGQESTDSTGDESFKDFFKLDEKLEKLLTEQRKLREASKTHTSSNGGPHIDEVVRKLTIWLIPLVAVMMVMAYYTFRIRQEIVKTKLL